MGTGPPPPTLPNGSLDTPGSGGQVLANPLISTLTDAVSLLIYIYVAKLILKI